MADAPAEGAEPQPEAAPEGDAATEAEAEATGGDAAVSSPDEPAADGAGPPADGEAPLLADGVPIEETSMAGMLQSAGMAVVAANAMAESAPEMEKAEERSGGGGADFPTWATFTVKETQRFCKAVFVPEAYRLSKKEMDELLLKWEVNPYMGKPLNTLVYADCGVVHPNDFAVPKLVQPKPKGLGLPNFKKFWDQAMKHASSEWCEDGSTALGNAIAQTPVNVEEFAMEVINDVIFLKLITIFVSVLEGAMINNNYIVIDRTANKSASAELLIEMALAKTSVKPVVLVIDSFNRLTKNFKGQDGNGPLSEQTKKCIDTMRAVQKLGIALASDDAPKTTDIFGFYDVEDFKDHRKFYNAFQGAPSGDPKQGSEETNYPAEIPRPVETKAHLNPDGSVNERFKWSYHYLQTFYGGGNHYILLENVQNAPDLNQIGPKGFIAANGQGMMAPRLKNLIQQGESLVMLHNTGGVTQAFASLREAMRRVPQPEPSELLDMIHIVSAQPWSRAFGLPEIHMMKELTERAPMILDDTCMGVDVMNDSFDRVLNTMTCCFAGGGGVPELGLGEAEEMCILTAWKRHMTLIDNASAYERQADAIQLFLYFLAILTTTLTVFYAMERADADMAAALAALPSFADITGSWPPPLPPPIDLGSGFEGFVEEGEGEIAAVPADDAAAAEAPAGPIDMTPVELIMVLLPIFSALMNGIRSRSRPREKWASCQMAAFQIVDQIYKFRLRTEAYDPNPPPKEGEEDMPPVPPKQREKMSRAAFVAICQEIYSQAISKEVSKGGSLNVNKTGRLDFDDKEQRKEFMGKLRQHVTVIVLGQSAPPPPATKKAQVAPAPPDEEDFDDTEAEANKEAEKKADEEEDEEDGAVSYFDDLTKQMNVETYVDTRLRPMTEYFELRAPEMSRRYNLCEAMSIAANTAGAVLAVIDMAEWIAITVAVASVSMALEDYFYMPSQISENNRVLAECHNVLLWWDCLSLVQKKARSTKLRICLTCESSILSVISARTATSAALPGQGGEEE